MRNIAVVAGGNSSEWVISVQSGAMVAAEMERIGYKAYLVQIKEQEWQVLLSEDRKIDIDKNDFSFLLEGKKVVFDCALIAIHGTPGEDGKLQAYFELVGLPYTTCGVLSSALTFNKNACKIYLNDFGVKSAKAMLLSKHSTFSAKEVEEELGMPCFVKPNESGSSFGVTKVDNPEVLESAIDKALTEGADVIIEQFIQGTEVTCGLVKTKEKEIIFPITEIVSKKDFFDFEAKYTPGMSEEITPARISPEMTQKVKELSSVIYNALDCKGIVRIDYIISGHEVYFLEVNTVPGMSPNSIVPKMLREMGSSLADVYKLIIEEICQISMKGNAYHRKA